MKWSTKKHVSSSVMLDDKGIVVTIVRGKQDQQTLQKMYAQTRDSIAQLRAQGKKALVYVDIEGLRANDVSSSARQQARKMMSHVPVDKSAIVGGGPWVSLIMYLVRATGVKNNVQFFRNKNQAYAWLLDDKAKELDRPKASLVVGLMLLAIGITSLIGWQIDNQYLTRWITSLRPMNPLAAVGIIGAGIATVSYWMHRITMMRWLGIASLMLGFGALLPGHVDYILYGDQVRSAGIHAQLADSAAVCFIVMGVVGLIADRKAKWVHPVEWVLAAIMGSLALINIFGQLYAHDTFYTNTSNFVMAFSLAVAFLLASAALIISILYHQLGKNVITSITRTGWLVVLALLVLQIATYGVWSQAISQNKVAASAAFNRDSHAVQDVLSERFTAYINALYGFEGLFLASSSVTQGEFETYYYTTNIATQYPGLRAFSFISKVSTSELPAYIQERRTDTSLNSAGNPAFTVNQLTPGQQHYIVTYLAGTSSTPGTDLASNPIRVAAFQAAEARGGPIASGTIQFQATATRSAQKGFFLSIPVAYKTDPHKTIGYVNAVFDYADFFKDTFASATPQKDLYVTVTDSLDNKSVYSSGQASGQKLAQYYNAPIAVADRTWNLRIGASATYGNAKLNATKDILAAGQAFSLLLIIIFWIQARGRQHALDLADTITEDLQQERNRAVANDQKSTAILASIGDGVFAIDTQGRLAVLNLAAQTISGLSANEVLGKPYGDVLRFEHERTGTVNDSFVKRALAGHMASMSNHTVLIRADGRRVPVADSAAPIRDGTGQIIGAIVVFRDVSHEYELDKAKTEFVSLASHQLRTPLSAINWYGEMLLGGDAGKLTKDQHEYIKEIFEGSQRMVELVNSLLDVSRLEVGKLANNPEPTDVRAVIEALQKELAVSIDSKHLTLVKHLSPISNVVTDPKQLRMIVQNLMSNAVKYTAEKGKVTVTLRQATAHDMHAAALKGTGPHWFFSVQDTGYGIPKDQQHKIFGKLFRADNVRKLDVEGTGLGLYIVKEVVEKMGGRVWFESMESVGTTFFVVAPISPKHTKSATHHNQQKGKS